MNVKIKIWLADDHQLVRQGFKVLLEQMDQVEIVGESNSGKELIHFLREGSRVNIALLDVEMPIMGGIETLSIIKKEFFGTKVILLTMLNDKELIQKAHELGAEGFLFKNTNAKELADAIMRVSSGEKYFAPDVSLALLNQSKKIELKEGVVLSEREVEILKLITEGLSSTEIGQKLFISPRTVDTHRNNMIQKLEVNGVIGLVKYALQNKLV